MYLDCQQQCCTYMAYYFTLAAPILIILFSEMLSFIKKNQNKK
jgi:hypothetical protein